MGTSGVNSLLHDSMAPKGGISSGQSAWDSHETSIRNEIKRLQEEMKTLSKDEKLSEEQRARQKQALQEKIQSLNSELRQYKLEKRQEEVQRKQEGAKPDAGKTDKSADEDKQTFGSEKLGVIITISLSQDQVTNLEKVRKDMEGRQRTAGTQEEKEKLQKKKDIGEKIIIMDDSLKNTQGSGKFGTGVIGIKRAGNTVTKRAGDGKEDSSGTTGRKPSGNQNELFGNVSVVLS